MADDRVVLTAELKDEMSAPLGRVTAAVDQATKAVEKGNKRQAAAATSATGQIDKAISKQTKIFGALPGVFSKADKAAGGLFSGTASAVTKHLTTAADKAKAAGAKVGDNLNDGLKSRLPSFSNTLKTVAGLVGGFLVGSALNGGISRALNIEDAQAKLKGLGHDAATITEIMNNASASVKGTAFGLGDAATVAAGAVAAGIKPGKDLERVLALTGDAATIAGTELSEMGSIFNKVAASGKLQGDVIAQLQDAGVPVLQFVAKEIGKTAAETSKLASDGKIDFATFANAMEAGLGGAALASGNTFRGSIKNMKAAVSRIAETVVKPFLGLIQSGANAVIPVLDGVNAKLKPLMQSFTDGISGVKAAIAGGGTIQNIAEAFGLTPAAAAVFASVIGPARAFVATLKDGGSDITSNGLAGWFEGVAVGINHFRAGLTLAPADVESLSGELDGMVLVGVKVREFFDGLVESTGGLLPKLGELAVALSPALLVFEALLPVLPSLIESVGVLADALAGALGGALDILAPILAGALVSLAEIVDLIVSAPGGAEALAAMIVTVGAAFLAYKAAVSTTSAVMRGYAAITGVVKSAKAAYTGVVYALIAAQYGLTASSMADVKAGKTGAAVYLVKAAALKVATGATKLFNAAMKANPIAKVIAVVGLLVAGLVWFFTKTETGQAIVQAAWAGIQAAIAGVVNFWNSTLLPALQAVGQWFSDVWGNVVTWVTGAVSKIREVLGAVGAWFASTFGPTISAIGTVFSAVFGFIGTLVTNAVLVIMAVLKIVGDWLTMVFTPILQGFGAFFSAIWDGLVWVVQRFVAGVMVYVNMVVLFWQTILFPALQAVGSFFAAIWNGILAAVNWVITGIMAGVGLVVGFWNGVLVPALQFVGSIFASIWNGIVAVVQMAIDGVQSVIQGLVNFWNGTLSPAIDTVAGFFSGVLSSAIGGVTGFIDKASTGFQCFVNFIRDKVQPIIDSIGGAFSALGEKIGGAVQGIKDFAANPLGGAGDWAKDVLGVGNSGGGVYSGGGIAGFAGGGIARFAGGGVLGGYAPGRDTIPAILSKGEAVLVPELVRAIGPQNIMAANAQASGGRPAGGGPALLSGYSRADGMLRASGGATLAPARPLPAIGTTSTTANYNGTTVTIEKVEVNVDNSGGGMTPEEVAEAVEDGIEKAFKKARKRDY